MIPHAPGVDSTVALLRHGYLFISETCHRLDADAFRTRLLGRPVVCARGASAAQMFYDADRFTRRGAMPTSVVHLLQDVGSVQALDGAAHRRRKELFLAAVPQRDATSLTDALRWQWHSAAARWGRQDRVVLITEMERVHTAAALRWSGVPLDGEDLDLRTTQLAAMVNHAGSDRSGQLVGALAATAM